MGRGGRRSAPPDRRGDALPGGIRPASRRACERLPDADRPDSGRSLAVALFETEEDLRKGDEALNAMSPESGDEVGKRTSVEKYEVAVDVRP